MTNKPTPQILAALSAHLDQLITAASRSSGPSDQERQQLLLVAREVKALADTDPGGDRDADCFLMKLYQNLPGPEDTPVVAPAPSVSPSVPAEQPNVFFLSTGKRIVLGSRLSQGGEGTVYRIPSLPGKVAKLFHQPRRTQDLEHKLRYLCTQKQHAYIGSTLLAAFPDELLYNAQGDFCGYIMQFMPTTMNLTNVIRDSPLREKAMPDLNYRGLIVIAYNLAEAVCHLHSRDIIIGDMNQNNILVNPDGTVYLIDCDSFDVTDGAGHHYPCCVGLVELLAPELQGEGVLGKKRFTKESDCFSLAIHLFRLLMQNTDPFAFSPAPRKKRSVPSVSMDLAKNQSILNGECIYFREIPGKVLPQWAPPLELLPPYLVELFRRTFDYGADTMQDRIADRPTAQEWLDALARMYREPMKPCTRKKFHWYRKELSECPLCKTSSQPPKNPLRELLRRSQTRFSKQEE